MSSLQRVVRPLRLFRGTFGCPFLYLGANMTRTAVFVDAGYLHAQGSALLAGQKQPREQIILDIDRTLRHLRKFCNENAPDERLLRVYWYDGLQRNGRMSSEQEQIAGAQFAKLRLGVVNSNGDQKGVDSLIVTDLIDLARNRAITSAVLMSGDEDIRIGVQIAQTFGVQFHLLGIKPAKGSQSPDLIRESDTHHEWDESIISDIMVIRPIVQKSANFPDSDLGGVPLTAFIETTDFSIFGKQAIDEVFQSLDSAVAANAILAFKANPSNVPPELDRPALGRLRSLLKRELSDSERKDYRKQFRSYLTLK